MKLQNIKDNGKEYIILTGYELKFNPNGVNITQPEADSKSGGLEQKQSIYSLDGEGFDLLGVLKKRPKILMYML